ncbi:MAG: hypothetical protein APF76_13655 [Desulfitibacter sp. BRH_c19]|nr:MAG: hypothetical protein APF76_13655 [Desulfitibacter sp. BRH_c19]
MADLNSAVKEVKKGNVFPIYLLTGDNDFLKDILIGNFKEALLQGENGEFNFQKYDHVDTLKAIIDVANSLPFFSKWRLIVVKDESVFKPGSFSDNDYKYVTEYLTNPNPTTCLIFLARSDVDKRGKLYKKLSEKGKVLNCETPKGVSIINWINREFSTYEKNPDNALVNILASVAKGDLYFLTNEIKKICSYVGNKQAIYYEEVREVLAKTIDTGIFQMIDHLAEKDLNKALKELNDLLELGEAPILINNMLARHYRLLLHYLVYKKKGYSEKQLSQKLGVRFFVVSKLSSQSKHYNQRKLIDTLNILYENDLKIKTTSSDNRRMLELTLIELAN